MSRRLFLGVGLALAAAACASLSPSDRAAESKPQLATVTLSISGMT